MILDHLDNWRTYPGPAAWAEALHFVAGLGPDAAEGDYAIRGSDIWARVSVYETWPLENSVLEAHREFVDIQAVLAGEEVQGCYPVRDLRVKTPYDPKADIEFFEHPAAYSTVWRLKPGLFSAFFPQDAHMSRGLVAAPAPVRKVVLKVRGSLLAL